MKNTEYTHLQIEADEAEEILWDLYKFKGKATRLPGEYDMNFKINSEGLGDNNLKFAGLIFHNLFGIQNINKNH